MNLITQIKDFIDKNKLLENNQTVILGLSGGPDSVFLLEIFNKLAVEYNLQIIAAHLDHQWRVDSHKDALFCKKLCEKLSIKFELEQANNIKLEKKSKSLEETGRLLRRSFFENLAKKYNSNLIALAHHADDQQETFFIRLIRGATLSGLVSIRPKSEVKTNNKNIFYIRPLLNIYKSEILNYLERNKIKYITDITNLSDKFLRNKIRKHVIPALQKTDSRFNINFQKTLNNLSDTENFLENLTNNTYNNLKLTNKNLISLNFQDLLNLDIFLQKRIILSWLCENKVNFSLSDKFLNEILKFFNNKKSKQHKLSTDWSIIKDKKTVYINKK